MSLLPIPTKKCESCGNEFAKKSNCSKKEWGKRRGCSPSCAAKIRGLAWLEAVRFQPGSHIGKATQFKKGQTPHNWKGDNASYAAIHMWVRAHYGTPRSCELCKTTDRKMYHWSNISGEYKRERSDWQRLCVPCHKRYDLGQIKLGAVTPPIAYRKDGRTLRSLPLHHI
jgi:hypothetical protein